MTQSYGVVLFGTPCICLIIHFIGIKCTYGLTYSFIILYLIVLAVALFTVESHYFENTAQHWSLPNTLIAPQTE